MRTKQPDMNLFGFRILRAGEIDFDLGQS